MMPPAIVNAKANSGGGADSVMSESMSENSQTLTVSPLANVLLPVSNYRLPVRASKMRGVALTAARIWVETAKSQTLEGKK